MQHTAVNSKGFPLPRTQRRYAMPHCTFYWTGPFLQAVRLLHQYPASSFIVSTERTVYKAIKWHPQSGILKYLHQRTTLYVANVVACAGALGIRYSKALHPSARCTAFACSGHNARCLHRRLSGRTTRKLEWSAKTTQCRLITENISLQHPAPAKPSNSG